MRNDPFMGDAVVLGGQASQRPQAEASLTKIDNGYVLAFVKHPKHPKQEPVEPISPVEAGEAVEEAAQSEDEQIDTIVDGLQSFFRAIHGEQGDGHWRGEDEREKIRKAVKMLNAQRGGSYKSVRSYKPPPAPEIRQMVFETKAKLLEFLQENL